MGKNVVTAAVESGAKKVRGVGRAIKKGVGVGVGAAQFYRDVHNPINQHKFLSGVAVKGEFIYPGSKYIGPGNSMHKGKPTSVEDANAYQHDLDYGNYLKKGHKAKDVYLGYSDADERLLRKTKANTGRGFAINAGMLFKKGLNKTGLTKRIRDTDNPEMGGDAVKSTSSDISGGGRQKQY